MLLYLFYHVLQPYFHALNVFRYITVRTALASLTALLITLVLGPWVIQRLRELQIGQFIREEGPKSHQSKAGTPTMGGVLIVGSTVIPTLLWGDLENAYVWLAVLTMLIFGIIGFIDDYSKVMKKRNLGLTGKRKFSLQIVASCAVAVTPAVAHGERHLLHATERSIFQEFSSGPGDPFASVHAISLVVLLLPVFDFCGAGHRRVVQRRESHGRSGRARDRLRGGRRRGAHGFDLCDQLRAVLGVSGHPASARRWAS